MGKSNTWSEDSSGHFKFQFPSFHILGTSPEIDTVANLFVLRLLETMNYLGYEFILSSDLSSNHGQSSLFFKEAEWVSLAFVKRTVFETRIQNFLQVAEQSLATQGTFKKANIFGIFLYCRVRTRKRPLKPPKQGTQTPEEIPKTHFFISSGHRNCSKPRPGMQAKTYAIKYRRG